MTDGTKDFSPIIKKSLELGGFKEDEEVKEDPLDHGIKKSPKKIDDYYKRASPKRETQGGDLTIHIPIVNDDDIPEYNVKD